MKPELLAPAGSFEGLKAVINAGADAVYLGGSMFGARAYAANFEKDALIEAIRYAHLFGVDVHLTVNTLLKDTEINTLVDYIAPYYEAGLDAVIVQDLGVMSVIKNNFEDLPVHMSTQLSLCGSDSVKMLKEYGAQRAVLAREMSLEEIKNIINESDIEIETFIHGALCYCYSGRCLLSSILGGRSGNRGRCAQPCRLEYDAYCNGKKVNNDNERCLLSPKDICTLDILPELIDAGIASFKIEGRMKKPEYASGVISVYRKYIDMYLRQPEEYHVDDKDRKLLFDLFNRDGFSSGYYKCHNGREMMALVNEKQNHINRDTESAFAEIKEKYIDKNKKISTYGFANFTRENFSELVLIANETASGSIGDIPQPAVNQPITKEKIEEQLRKTGNTPFSFYELNVDCEDGLFIPVKQLNELRRSAFESLENSICEKKMRSFDGQKNVVTDEVKEHDDLNKTKADKLNRLSVQVSDMDQLKAAAEYDEVEFIIYDGTFSGKEEFTHFSQDFCKICKETGKRSCIALPQIFRNIAYKEAYLKCEADAFLVRDMEGYAYLKKNGLEERIICDSSLYTFNRYSKQFFGNCLGDTVSSELNYKEMLSRDNGRSAINIYGYMPLMISAQCVKKSCGKCDRKESWTDLKDRKGKFFKVKSICNHCYSVLYNSEPLSLYSEADKVKKLGFRYLRLSFTSENRYETKEIISRFIDRFDKGIDIGHYPKQYTKGHFARGVE